MDVRLPYLAFIGLFEIIKSRTAICTPDFIEFFFYKAPLYLSKLQFVRVLPQLCCGLGEKRTRAVLFSGKNEFFPKEFYVYSQEEISWEDFPL